MSKQCSVIIDFSDAISDLDRCDLEEFLLVIADELESGKLAYSARLTRNEDIPEAAKSGIGSFVTGVLTAEISRDNLSRLVDYVGNLRYGKVLTVSGDIDGMTYSIEYRNKQELDQAADTIERLANLRIKIQGAQSHSKSN